MSYDPTYPHNLSPLPPQGSFRNEEFSEFLLKSRVELAELKGACGQIPNPMLLISPAIIRESLASSNIENINTTLIDVLQGQLFPEAEQRVPDKEVLRYREALFWGYTNIGKHALSTRTVLGIQKKLIPESHGAYRGVPNRIINISTGEILYTPPPANDVPNLMGNWEVYVNDGPQDIDPLIRAAIAHYQFESIHPFEDGNGRTGRILMVLQLIMDGLLTLPVLYISGYINKNRSKYYRLLHDVTANDNWHGFINFMLNGFFLQARETKDDLQKVTSLFQEIKNRLRTENKKIYSAELVEALFTYPVISPTKLAGELDMHYTTTSKYLQELTKSGILKEAKVGKYHLFANEPLIKILSK